MEAIQIKERNASKVKGEKSVFTNMKLVTPIQICKFHTLNGNLSIACFLVAKTLRKINLVIICII